MAGIGDYEEGKPFSLKSGNKPTFKNMGSSPNNYGTPGNMPIDNFGLAPGDSPYPQNEEEEDKSTTTTVDPVEGGDSGWKKALKIGVAGLTGGLDAVYGTGKVVPMVSHVKKTKEVEDNPVSTEIKENIKEVSGISDKESSKKMDDAEWNKVQEKAKEMGHDINDLVSKQKSLDKGSQEWKDNQNLINEALGNTKRH